MNELTTCPACGALELYYHRWSTSSGISCAKCHIAVALSREDVVRTAIKLYKDSVAAPEPCGCPVPDGSREHRRRFHGQLA